MLEFNFPRWPLALAAGAVIGTIALRASPDLVSRVQDKTTYPRCAAIDGDTLACGNQRIRLLGVDAAEMPGHCRQGRVCAPGDPYAQQEALALFAQGPMTIRPVTTDRYGRTVASVINARGDNASCVALKAGALYKPEWDSRSEIQLTCALKAIQSLTTKSGPKQ